MKLIKHNLFRRHKTPDSLCEEFGKETETTAHVLVVVLELMRQECLW